MRWNVAGYLVMLGIVMSGYYQAHDHSTVYASDEVKHQSFTIISDSFTHDLPDPYQNLILKSNESGHYIWYLYLHTPVCMTGECKEVDVGLYWHFDGEFMGYEVYQEHLTRTDHSQFSDVDYQRLTQVLSDKSSILGEYAYEDLLIVPADSSVDGITGATRQDITSEAVEGAVYTCFTLWHICHGAIKVYIQDLTRSLMDTGEIDLSDVIEERVIRYLLTMLVDDKIKFQSIFESYIFQYLRGSDSEMKKLSFQAIGKIDLENEHNQTRLSEIFPSLTFQEKVQMLKHLQDIQILEPLLASISAPLNFQNTWLSAKILDVLSNYPLQDSSHISYAKELSNHSRSYIREPARNFLRKVNQE